jgi:hypothetical protein
VLRGVPVVYGNYDAWRTIGDCPAIGVLRVEIADDPAAAVKIDAKREPTLTVGRIDARRHVTRGSGNGDIVHLCDRLAGGHERALFGELLAGLPDRQRVQGFFGRYEGQSEESLCERVKGHGVSSCNP